MVNNFLQGGLLISALVQQVQLNHSCDQQAFQELYDGNHQQLDFIPHFIQKVECDVQCDGH